MSDVRTVRELEEALENAETDYELLQDEYKQLLIDLSRKDAVIKDLEKDVAFYRRYQTEKYKDHE